ncbi:MAG: response regulator transcription factor [Bacteroidetes bacterium]|nr:response regulator transcription factor [Bacteroidota bacterium]MBP7400489.1 response regulator transcription factor [Chitinophagales bacterium]MBK7110684.1 response regulator transcription factor [Bacteroidota bacterium]MBK8488095.1 response regulator transcription factor [Bacteroidota bacterium]MBK8682146.1 response regulator transcription factor [Bacteroidota bacterium]
MISTLIIENDNNSSNTLESLLCESCPLVSIVGTTNNYTDAINCIEKIHPDLVFLDVDMPHLKGLETFNHYYPSAFEIIVTSNSEKFAIQALNCCASGYLLKPIKLKKLITSVNYATQRIQDKKVNKQNNVTDNNALKKFVLQEIIGIPTIEGYEYIPVKDIIRCEGMQKYTRVITVDKTDLISSYNLGEFIKRLDCHGFYSPHKSHLINLKMVRKYHNEGNVLMLNGSWVPVAKRRKKEFLGQIEHL